MIKINQKEIEEQLLINLIQQIHITNFRSSFTKPTSGETKSYFYILHLKFFYIQSLNLDTHTVYLTFVDLWFCFHVIRTFLV